MERFVIFVSVGVRWW